VSPRRFSLSIDTGGTFTDGFVSDGQASAQVKVDTTPHDLTTGFAACVEAAAEAVGEPLPRFLSALDALHFSSTIATNTVVERRGARVGLLVTRGEEDRLTASLGEFVPAELVRGVSERTDDDGRVVAAPSEDELAAGVRELLERGVGLLVISFANAHRNDANELAARQFIDGSYPRHYLGAVPLMLGSRVSLAADDAGRTALAVVNAYLHPSLVRALYRAEDHTRDRGLRRPLLVVNTDGSTSRVAKTRAIDTYNSGPSAGVLGSAYVAEALGARDVRTFDVGGTTTDVAHVRRGAATRDAETDVGPLRVPHPAVALHTFGLGGGSIIRAEGGAILVGPQSAGANPGPACFGLGGTALTPTDVWLLLGLLEPGEFLGGRRRLDRDRAQAAADAVGLDPLAAQAAIERTLREQLSAWMAGRPELTEAPEAERWLFSYGGGGGLLCAAAADALGAGNVAVFPHSSVFSAFGGGLLPIAHAYQAVARAGDTVARLADNARRDLRAEGVTDLNAVQARVAVGDGAPVETTLAALLDQGTNGGGEGVCRLWVTVDRERDVAMRAAGAGAGGGTREILTADGPLRVPVAGGLGRPGAPVVDGPAFLQAPDTTIFVPAGWTVAFTEQGYGVMTRRERG
jgi:N-methylhydantoinase A/oxoprolinase/acetone carboxylase beta subunit